VHTGQQTHLVDRAFAELGLRPDLDLGVIAAGLAQTTGALLGAVGRVLEPVPVIVHGDTSSALAGALAGVYARQPVAHVEAGLRSGDPDRPFPEEQHRVVIDRLATWWFAPTASARRTLLSEGCAADRVHLVGNPVVDALYAARSRGGVVPVELLDRTRPVVLVTCHRRENRGAPMERVAAALRRLQPTHRIVVVAHPHPATACVAEAAEHLVGPMDHADFVALLDRADVVLTDSGGVQEEAVASGRRALVLREETERPEGIELGLLELVGTDPDRIVAAVRGERGRAAVEVGAPYGRGDAGERIAEVLMGGAR
jgi:UDP-N-acetylglucosamine 2-epimerase